MSGYYGAIGGGLETVAAYSSLPASPADGDAVLITNNNLLVRWSDDFNDWLPYFLYNEGDPSTLSIAVPVWINANDITDTTGSNVNTWPNRGTEADFVASGGSRPDIQAAGGPNGDVSVNFNGSGEVMDGSATMDIAVSVEYLYSFAVVKPDTVAAGQDGIWGSSIDTGGGTDSRFYHGRNAATWEIGGRTSDGGALATDTGGVATVSTWQLTVAIAKYKRGENFIGTNIPEIDVIHANNSWGGTSTTDANNAKEAYVGGAPEGMLWEGDIYEIFVTDGNTDLGERAFIIAEWLKARAGL